MEQNIFSISQVNEYIRSSIEKDPFLSAVCVRGEVSNYKIYPSGHHYFTLKDENASLKCVMFRMNASRIKFKPDNGMKIIAFGKIGVYPKDGVYQLYCTALLADGVGDLQAAFEQLKKKLSAQGIFDPEHKKPLPKFPKRIGIITSEAGAAVHDIIKVLRSRFPLINVILYPVRVQGEEAPAEIVSAIALANEHRLADILIVGRGGGSIEDLWAFNDERVALAIYNSQIPVISAVGHEPDVTISDYVADVRAATPSNAAEIAVPDRNLLNQNLDSFSESMMLLLTRRLTAAKKHLSILSASASLNSCEYYIKQKRQLLSYYTNNLEAALNQNIAKYKQKHISLAAKIDAMSPLKVLTRGYAIVKNQDRVVNSVSFIKKGDTVSVSVSDGEITAHVTDVRRRSS